MEVHEPIEDLPAPPTDDPKPRSLHFEHEPFQRPGGHNLSNENHCLARLVIPANRIEKVGG